MTRLLTSILLTIVMGVVLIIVSPFMAVGVMCEILEGRR
jgi:hypothetical protein